MPRQEGQLHLLGAPHWSSADSVRFDVPDNLPGYLVAYLACRADWVSREALAGLFWPERAEDEAQHNLRANLHRVRALLASWQQPDALQADRRRVRIDLPNDVATFRSALARGDWTAAARLHDDALLAALTFRGLAPLDEWARAERQTLGQGWCDATLKAAQEYERNGDAGPAVAVLLRLAQTEWATEACVQRLLRLAQAAGRREEVLAAYEKYRACLQADLGIAPLPLTVSLADALRTAAPAHAPARPLPPATAAVTTTAAPRVLLLGEPQLHGAQVHLFVPERRFQLLAILAVNSGEWLARDTVAGLLWPEHALADARRNLRHVVFKARTLAGAEGIEATDQTLRWQVATDLAALRQALQHGRPGEAIALRRGTPLAGLDDAANTEFATWLAAERARIDGLWHQAALDHLGRLTSPAQRVELAQQLLQRDPLDESAMSALLEAELAAGNRGAAEQRYRAYAARLAEDLGVEPSHALRDRMAGTSQPPPVPLTARSSPAPAVPGAVATKTAHTAGADDALVGRRTELAELALLLARPDCRLITVLGPGGIGKSSLVRRAMTAGVAGFPGGRVWVELQDVGDIASATTRLARQLGVDLVEGNDAVDQIAARLAGARTLVVLDNAEHLSGLPALLDRLLAAGPALTLLLTSRVRMACALEWLLPLEGLAVPDAESRDLEAAQVFDAVRLFELRATAAQRGFSLARHLGATLDIVESVAGLPLAIELAAAWVRLLPPEEIARELRSSPDLLERDPGSPGRPARPEHASIRNVLERSWHLLGPRERDAMLGLAVFRSGFTRAAARAVADAPLPVLSSLVDKSFLKVDEGGRFSMHPLVAADVAARAAADAAARSTRFDRHAAYFAHELGDLATRHPIDHRPLVAALNAERTDFDAAWRHAVTAARHDLVRRMLPAWRRYFAATGHIADAIRHLQPALAMPAGEAAALALAEVRAALAFCLVRSRAPERAKALALAALEVAESSNDGRLMRDCIGTMGGCEMALSRWQDARAWFERARQVSDTHGDRQGVAVALRNLGLVATFEGDFERALVCTTEAISLQRDLGDHVSVARGLCNATFLHMARTDWAQARAAGERALRYTLEHRVDAVAMDAEFLLGAALVDAGDLDAAEQHLVRARERCRTLRNAVFELKADYYLARVAARRGRRDEGMRGLLSAARSAHELGWIDDMLYIAIFVSEVLRDGTRPREAALILHSALAAPPEDADAAIRSLAAACLRSLPVPAVADIAPAGGAVPFATVALCLATSATFEALVARLHASTA